MLEVKTFPSDVSSVPVNPKRPADCLFTGLYEESVEVNGKQRTFYTYLKPQLKYVRPCVFVLPDDKESSLSYLEKSFWMDFANRENVFLFILKPENGSWNLDGSDADYLNRVYMQVQSRNYYVTIQDTMYAVGIGNGAVVAQQATMKMTSEWAGLATFGDLSEAAMLNSGVVHKTEDTGRVELAVSGVKAQLPVWMFWKKNSGINAEVCAYWKVQNSSNLQCFSTSDADEVYFPTTVVKKSQLNEQVMSEVRITNGFEGELSQEKWNSVWNFLKQAFRYRSYGSGKMLRRRKELSDYGLSLHSMEHDGYTRIWYEYVPESVKNEEGLIPLVSAQHARGSSAEFYVSLSDMTTIAEERGFIVVFPEAGFYQQKKPDGLRNIPLWCGNDNGKDFDDVGFILKVIKDVKSRYNIDPSRVYACGQSSGGMMTSTLGLAASDTFAAVACSAALVSPDHELILPETINPQIPYLFMFGDKDWLVTDKNGVGEMDFGCCSDIAKFVRRIIKIYNLEEKPMVYKSGEITFFVYMNSRKVPMFTVGRVKGMSHAIYPRENWIMYDEFMSKFCRDADGTLKYMGEPVL